MQVVDKVHFQTVKCFSKLRLSKRPDFSSFFERGELGVHIVRRSNRVETGVPEKVVAKRAFLG